MAETLSITDQEQEVIHGEFEKLLLSMEPSLIHDDKANLQKAFELANHAHRNQRRKSGEPYILHPIEVARICYQEIGLGPTAVISALLHDIVEDTPVTQEEILKLFGSKISKIVDGLTKIDGLYHKESANLESPQAENFKKVLSTLVEDVRVVLIKMADRLHNLRTIGSMPKHKQLKISAETSYIYIPLAHRLGLYSVKTEFQDICMKITTKKKCSI
jgi:GTP pyrophosphokinase